MKKLTKVLEFTLVTVFVLLTVACGQSSQSSSAASSQPISAAVSTVDSSKDIKNIELTIAAAASLKDAMEELKTLYTADNKNVKITYTFAASGTLQQQIEQGANIDIFFSAATKQMDALKTKGLIIDDTDKNFLQNEVVLVVPKDSSVSDFKDLATDKVKKIGLGEPKSVPAGQYGEEVLTNLKLLGSVKPKAVYGNDVKEVLKWVETGNADAGIVYATDALISDKVKVAAKAPDGSHKPINYPAAVIKDSKNQDAAKDFINFIYSDKAKPVFEKYGFKFIL